MRTSFHHQSEAQPPNGRLTAATSPDTPPAKPTTHSFDSRRRPATPQMAGSCGWVSVSAEYPSGEDPVVWCGRREASKSRIGIWNIVNRLPLHWA
jgi:hypothetical protein